MSTLRAPAETDLTRFYAIFPQPAINAPRCIHRV